MDEHIDTCLLGFRDYVNKNGFKSVVLGLSGGIDSAICAAIAVDALGEEAGASGAAETLDRVVVTATRLEAVTAFDTPASISVVPMGDGGARTQAALSEVLDGVPGVLDPRGLIGSLSGRVVVASPLYKNHFDLQTGECLEMPEHSVRTYSVRAVRGRVSVAGAPAA